MIPNNMIDEQALHEAIRERVKKLRTSSNDFRMSQEDLAAVLQLKRSSVANLETGKQKFSIYNVYCICAHLGIELVDLLPAIDSVEGRGKDTDGDELPPEASMALRKMRGIEE